MNDNIIQVRDLKKHYGNGKIKALKISTLNKLCRVLECQPSDLLEYIETEDEDDEE